MFGDSGADVLYGGTGNDALTGGPDADRLEGGDGKDSYTLDRNTGFDIVIDNGPDNAIQIGAGIDPSDVSLYLIPVAPVDFAQRLPRAATPGLLIRVDANNELYVPDFDASRQQYQINFANGAVWSAADVRARIQNLTGLPTQHAGSTANDTFTVDHPDDAIVEQGGAGNDSIKSAISYTIPANIENLELTGSLNMHAVGNEANNMIAGNSGNNVLDGRAGLDYLIGGLGNDTYIVTSDQKYSWPYNGRRAGAYANSLAEAPWDVVIEAADQGTDTLVTSQFRVKLPENVENLLAAGIDIDNIAFDPSTARKSTGPTTAEGIFYFEQYKVYGDNRTDSRPWFLGNNLDNKIEISGRSIPSEGFFNSYVDDDIREVFGGVLIDGGLGADIMIGQDETTYYVVDNERDIVIDNGSSLDDTIISSAISISTKANIENLELLGSQALTATGDDQHNEIRASRNSAGNLLYGKKGNDIYYVGPNDQVIEGVNEGTDTVFIDITAFDGYNKMPTDRTFRLDAFANAENIAANGYFDWRSDPFYLEKDRPGVRLVGTNERNEITGSFQDDILEGGAGHDFIEDRLEQQGSYRGDVDNDQLYGGDGTDFLLSRAGSDILDGGKGNDLLSGTSDGRFVWRSGDGEDTILSSGTVLVDPSIELHRFSVSRSNDRIRIYLPDQTDAVNANSSVALSIDGAIISPRYLQAASLQGKMAGAASALADLVGVTVGSQDAHGLGGDDVVLGSMGADRLYGDEGHDLLIGRSGADILDGGAGGDQMYGGAGDDTYHVDVDVYRGSVPEFYDEVVENENNGTDLVISRSPYTLLRENIENLIMENGALEAFGNSLNNHIKGNAAANIIDGSFGDDILEGGNGDDEYTVDSVGDKIAETATGGSDHIISYVSWTLGQNVEKLTLSNFGPQGAINGTGNMLNNVLTGNDYTNRLDGGAGADTMHGGFGDDIYVVDAAGDSVWEYANEGTDTVESSVDWTLGNNVEHVLLTGAASVTATGNGLANTLRGNGSSNMLKGGAGRDLLEGFAGNDTLDGGSDNDEMAGGAGNDIYVFGRGSGQDIVKENDGSTNNRDAVHCSSGVASNQLWFRRQGTNLEIAIVGTGDKMTVSNWYGGAANHIESFVASDGKTLDHTRVDALVSAMSAFAPPAAGQTALPANYQTALNGVIAANWA